jgi:hypothetical protein
MYFCVMCLIVIALPPSKISFAVKLNNNNNKILVYVTKLDYVTTYCHVSVTSSLSVTVNMAHTSKAVTITTVHKNNFKI